MQLSHSFLALPAALVLGVSTSPTAPVPAAVSALAPPATASTSNASDALQRAVPADAMIFGAAWDIDGMRARGEKNAWYRFYQDEQMQALIDAAGELIGQAWEQEAEAPAIPFSVGQVLDAMHGSMVCFLSVDIPNDAVAAGLLFEVGEERAGLEEIFDGLIKLAEEEGDLESSADSYGGAELLRMSGVDGDGELIFIEHSGLLGAVISNTPEKGIETTQGVIDRFTGTDESLGYSDSRSLREARGITSGRQDFEICFDAAPMIAGLLSEEGPDEEERALMDRVGITKLSWVYAGYALGTGEQGEMTMSAYVPPGTYLADALALAGPAPTEMLRQVPAEADQISVGRFDLHGLVKLILNGVKDYDDESYQQINGMIQMAGAMNGVDIEQDVLAQITGDFASFMVPSTESIDMGETLMMGMAPGSALMLGIEDTEEFELFVDDILTNFQLDKMIETEEFMGREVRKVDMGGPAVYFTFTEDALVYAASLEPMHAILRMGASEGEQNSAFDNPEIKKLAGPNVITLGVADTATTIALELDMMSTMGEMLGMAGVELEGLSYLPWPDSAIAKKYFKGKLYSQMLRKGDALVVRAWSE